MIAVLGYAERLLYLTLFDVGAEMSAHRVRARPGSAEYIAATITSSARTSRDGGTVIHQPVARRWATGWSAGRR